MRTSLQGIANKARQQKEYRFRNLYGEINEEALKEAWHELNKEAPPGVDRVKGVKGDVHKKLRNLTVAY